MTQSPCERLRRLGLALVAVTGAALTGIVGSVGVPVHAAAQTAPAAAGKAAAGSPGEHRALLDRYCVSCHNGRLNTAGLNLESGHAALDDVGTQAERWEKVLEKLQTSAMPPPGLPRPDAAAYTRFAAWLEGELDGAAARALNPGRPTAHRLNRVEYAHAIRDLLALDVDPRALLPADDMSYGFDNNADLLSVSPGLLERQMSAARRISRMAVGDATVRPAQVSYKQPALMLQDERMGDDLPFGSRGGMAVRHYFPVDADYAIKVRLLRDGIYNIRGLAQPEQIHVRIDGVQVKQFTVGGMPDKTFASTYLDKSEADAHLELQVPVRAGSHTVAVTFPKRTAAVSGIVPERLPVANFILSPTARAMGFAELMGVATVQIGGPYNGRTPTDTPSRRAIFVCQPATRAAEPGCATKILGGLARRAYRRPVTNDDLETLLGFYRTARQAGGSFERGIQDALARMLVDPEFVFRLERDPAGIAPGTAYRLTDLEIASRLSFFLWSSIPDEPLLAAAEAGSLRDDATLTFHIKRMLADRRASSLVDTFAAQWLHLRNIRAVAPDVNLFPEFDENLRDAMQRETELFIESQLRDDRSVVDLLTADYTFLNDRLARHYGVDGVYGSHFRRVPLTDARRAGLLGHGSVLTVTSHATRTSPVLRGKWVLENVLGTPPPPPPPNIPPLPERGVDGHVTSVRERLEQHRKNPVCASCHSRMDPLGFALENFDGIGRWRSAGEDGRVIDTTASLPDGTKFDGPADLRQALLARRDAFAATVTVKLLTYALGRGIDHHDRPAIRAITRSAAAGDYRWSALIAAIVRSVPFQMRRSES